MENRFLMLLHYCNLSKYHHCIGLKNQENETISLNNTTMDLISSIRHKLELERIISKQQVIKLEQNIIDVSKECQIIREDNIKQQESFDIKIDNYRY
jgi:hypothetical protein